MSEPHMNYTLLIYGLIFLAMSLTFMGKVRKVTTSPLKNVFWAFTAFSIMKATSILSGLSIGFFSSENMLSVNNMFPVVIISILIAICSVMSNIFLFHFGISMLTYKTSIRINYKIFPILLLIGFMSLYFSGTIDLHNAERLSRHSFGFSGAFLGSLGCFNLFSIKKASGNKKLLSWLIIYGIALLLYSLTEGIITNPILGIQVELLRLISAVVLLTSSFIVTLLKEDRDERIGFI